MSRDSNKVIKNISNVKPFVYEFTKVKDITIGAYEKVEACRIIKELFDKREKVFEEIQSKSYQINKLQLHFNYHQKHLARMLLKRYGINIMEKPVSRAWLKMFELYNSTNYFENLAVGKNKIAALHICEAPGNFILASIEYVKRKIGSVEYDWTGQSIVEGDIFDSYGLIESNKDKWDFGKDNSGDITKYDNLLYYMNKYSGKIDSLVGDCGVPWDWKVQLPIDEYQMLYGLLIPRKGGNFIMKARTQDYTDIYMSLMYTVCCKYDKVYMFHSSRNPWSTEVYFIGKGFKGITDKEKDNLLKIAKSIGSDKQLYPVDRIMADFCSEFHYANGLVLDQMAEYKTFFAKMASDRTEYAGIKPTIEKEIFKKNMKWLEENF